MSPSEFATLRYHITMEPAITGCYFSVRINTGTNTNNSSTLLFKQKIIGTVNNGIINTYISPTCRNFGFPNLFFYFAIKMEISHLLKLFAKGNFEMLIQS